MRFFSLAGARSDLAATKYSDRAAFEYCMAFVVLSVMALSAFGHPVFTLETEVSIILVQVSVYFLPILGTWLVLYRAYDEKAGIPFFAAYFTLGWVANICAILIAFPLYVLYLFVRNTHPELTAVSWFSWVLAATSYNIAFFGILYGQIRRVTASAGP